MIRVKITFHLSQARIFRIKYEKDMFYNLVKTLNRYESQTTINIIIYKLVGWQYLM